MAKKKAAKRQAQDITVINLRATKKYIQSLVDKLEDKLTKRIDRRCKGSK